MIRSIYVVLFIRQNRSLGSGFLKVFLMLSSSHSALFILSLLAGQLPNLQASSSILPLLGYADIGLSSFRPVRLVQRSLHSTKSSYNWLSHNTVSTSHSRVSKKGTLLTVDQCHSCRIASMYKSYQDVSNLKLTLPARHPSFQETSVPIHTRGQG